MAQVIFQNITEDEKLRAAAVKAADSALNILSVNASMTIVFTDDAEITRLNTAFRNVESPTDVLSFPAEFQDPEEKLQYMGDVIISTEYANRQAHAQNHPFLQEIELLVVHGLLHLCGFDHTSPEEKTKMWSVQAEILSDLKNPLRPD